MDDGGTAPETVGQPTKPLPSRWGDFLLDEGSYYSWTCPSLRLWVRRKKRTLAMTHEYATDGPFDDGASSFVPADHTWGYRGLDKSPRKVSIRPVLPDRPIVFHLASPVVLLPGSSTSVYIELRAWIRFVDPLNPEQVIRELPTVEPNKAWFGATMTVGEICYWRKEAAALHPDEARGEPHLILCPVTVYNKSDGPLSLGTMYLRAEALSVFADATRLYTDRVQVTYTGENEVSQVTVSGKAPPFAPRATLLSEPREPVGRLQAAMAGAWNLLTRITIGDEE